MIINTNMAAIEANNSLESNTNQLQSSIQKLSSGLRINSAADDAAGLAISESMQTQMAGLQQAGRNTQDAVSLIQTADGSLQQTQNILAQMSTLATQAANDTYTASDRQSIQTEVDSLTAEIDQIANTANFNNKNLLDGSASAIVSADKSTTNVVVRGSVQNGNGTTAAGDYKIAIAATDPGFAQIQKSSIMQNQNSGGSVQHLVYEDNTGANTQGIYNVGATGITEADKWAVSSTVKQVGSSSAAFVTQYYAATGSLANATSCQLIISTQNVNNASVLVTLVSNGPVTSTYEVNYFAYNALGSSIAYSGSDAKMFSQTVAINFGSQDLFNLVCGALQMSFDMLDAKVGDEAVVNFKASMAATVTVDILNFHGSSSVNAGLAVSNSLQWAFNTGALNGTTTNLSFFSLDNDGTVENGTVSLGIQDLGNATQSGTYFAFQQGQGAASAMDTQLQNCANFYNSDGSFMLQNPQQLTLVEGDGKQTNITLYATDTLYQVQQKINGAIENGLGQGSELSNWTTDHNSFCTYVTNPDQNAGSTQVTEGTFVIRSAKVGNQGNISFLGDQSVMNALGLSTVQAATNTQFTVNVTNAMNPNDYIAKNLTVANPDLQSVLGDNVDVQFDPNADVNTNYNAQTKSFNITQNNATPYSTFVHIVDNTQTFQVGSSQGDTISAAIGNMGSNALGLTGMLVTDTNSAESAITTIQNAINLVSNERTQLGAAQNRITDSQTDAQVTDQNVTAAESNITDLDMATEMMNYSRLNILQQSGTAMLAQANQLPQSVLQLLGH